jgi:hypothetical protein
MLANPWFQRAWVYQEIVLSPKASFVVGSIAVSSMGLYWIVKTACNILPFCISDLEKEGISPHISAAEQATHILPIMLRAWADWNPLSYRPSEDSISFDAILSTLVPDTLTTEPVDRIYAFLGLNRRSQIVLEPNYRATLPEVLLDTAVAIIQGTQSLDILHFVSRMGSCRFGLPSWVPDFTRPEQCTPISSYRFSEERTHTFVPQFATARAGLIAKGKQLDQVFMISNSSTAELCDDWLKGELDFVINAWSCLKKQYPAPTLHGYIIVMCAHAYGEYGREYGTRGRQEPLASLVVDWISGAFKRFSCSEDPIYNLSRVAYKRHMIVTTLGRLGLVTKGTRPGDEICLLKGCLAPVVLRQRQDGDYFVIETCFLEKAMFLDAPVDWDEEQGKDFVLV